MKKIFTLMAVFALTMTAMAQTASLEFTGKGKEAIVVKMTNSDAVSSMGFKFELPAGTKVVFDEDEEAYMGTLNSERWTSKAGIDIKKIAGSENSYSVNIYGGKSKLNEGEICSIPVEGTLTGTVNIWFINFSGADGVSYYMDNDENKELTLELNPDAINAISAEQTKSGVIYNLNGQRVSKAQKGIFVVDGKKVAVK